VRITLGWRGGSVLSITAGGMYDYRWTVNSYSFEDGTEHKLHLKTQSVPRSKHTVSVTKTSQLMLYREVIAVCSEIHTKHINTLCGHNVVLFKPKLYLNTQSVPHSKHHLGCKNQSVNDV
jgi:hypothetical protein